MNAPRKQRLTLEADQGIVCVFAPLVVNPGDNCLASLSEEESCRRILSQPELLAACKAFMECPPRDRHDIALEMLVEEAITKAEGRE